MPKRQSEAELGAALRAVDGLALYVYRPPDPKSGAGVSNWKPCDFMVWWRASTPELEAQLVPPRAITLSSWFEAKDMAESVVEAFPFAELRPSQVQGIHDADRMGIPYWLAIWWRRHRTWTISDAAKVMAWRNDHGTSSSGTSGPPTSIPRALLSSRFGVDSSKAQLSSTLKAVLMGETR